MIRFIRYASMYRTIHEHLRYEIFCTRYDTYHTILATMHKPTCCFFSFFPFFFGRGGGGLVCWAWTFSVFFFPLLGHVRLFHFFFIIYFCFPRREILFYLFSFFLFIFWGLTRRVFFFKISRHDISFLINLSDCLFFFFFVVI